MHIISAHSPRKVSLFATRNGFLIETSLFRPLSKRVLSWRSKINKKVFLWLDWPSPTIDLIAEARVDWWVKRGSEGRSPINDLNSEARVIRCQAKGSGPMSMIRYTGLLIRAQVKKPGRLGLWNCIIEMLKQYRESCDLYVACFGAQMIQHLLLAKADALQSAVWQQGIKDSLLICSICCPDKSPLGMFDLSRMQISDLAIRFLGGILHQSAVNTSDENT